MPATQEGYRKLLSQIPAVKIFTGDKYHVEIKDREMSHRGRGSSTPYKQKRLKIISSLY